MKPRLTLSRALLVERTWPFFIDLSVAAALLAGFYAILWVAKFWFSSAIPEVEIYRSPSHLPLYAFYSVVRIFVAYALSLLFAVGYGYLAAYNKRLEALMIAILDILQSIPVLSFLPGVMLAMMSLFPSRQLGIEFGAILLIFTGEVWNMAFSFYTSLKSIPRELMEACAINRFSRWQRLFQLELPFAAIGLIWNSIVSVANGWFFLMVCEMFPVGSRNFRLPGLGSYLQTAASNGDFVAVTWGLLTMVLIIVLADQVLWRPLIAWSDKFKFENVESSNRVTSPVLDALRNSRVVGVINRFTFRPMVERLYMDMAHRRAKKKPRPVERPSSRTTTAVYLIAAVAVLIVIGIAAFHAVLLLKDIHRHEFITLLGCAVLTFVRVNAALLIGSLWTIPVGVAIGFNPRLSHIAQPVAQIARSSCWRWPASGWASALARLS
jgi:NitT/TauT family transport system permease protein